MLGIGIYPAGRDVAAAGRAPTAAADACRARRCDDDEQVIVVVDSQTGEIRQCGNLSGHCIGMNPWASRARPAGPRRSRSMRTAADLDARSDARPRDQRGATPDAAPTERSPRARRSLQRQRAREHRLEHRRGQPAGILVVARAMIAIDQDAAVGQAMLGEMAERDRRRACRPRSARRLSWAIWPSATSTRTFGSSASAAS